MDVQELKSLIEFVDENIPGRDKSLLILFRGNTVTTTGYAGSDYTSKMYEITNSMVINAIRYKIISDTEIKQPLFKLCDNKKCLKEYIRSYIQIALEMKEDDMTVGVNIYNKNGKHFYINVAADREMIYLEEE